MSELIAIVYPNEERAPSVREPGIATQNHCTTSVPASGYRSVLVPIDLTPSSDRVLGRLALLPLTDDARVTLLHVVPGSITPSEQRRAIRDANKTLADEVRHLKKLLDKKVRIEHVVKVGTPSRAIAESAPEMQAELIVMGRGSGRPVRDSFLGSTAERVVRQARLPVLVVRLAARAVYKRPAIALDLDQAARDVVRSMLRVLRPPRPRVDVFHAFTVPYLGLTYPSLTNNAADERTAQIRSDVALEVLERMASAVAQSGGRSTDELSWKTHVQQGSPRMVIEKALAKADSDLLVLGTRAYSGAAFMFLGSVAGDLLRAAKCDVLVVPPRAGSPP